MVWLGKFRSFKLMFLVLLNKLMKCRYSLVDKMSYVIPNYWMLLSNWQSEVRYGKVAFQCPMEGYIGMNRLMQERKKSEAQKKSMTSICMNHLFKPNPTRLYNI